MEKGEKDQEKRTKDEPIMDKDMLSRRISL